MSAYACFFRGDPSTFLGGYHNSNYANVAKSLAAAPEVWLTSRMAFDFEPAAGSVSGSSAFAQSIYYPAVYLVDYPMILEGIYRVTTTQWGSRAAGVANAISTPVLNPHEWYILESHFKQNVTRDSLISCDSGWSNSTVHNFPAVSYTVGCFAEVSAITGLGIFQPFEGYIDAVKIGTSRWGNDLFEDDFASGDFSAWTFHSPWSGTEGVIAPGKFGCTIVDHPNLPYFSHTCPAFDEVLTGVHLPPITQPYGSDYVER